MQDSKSQPRSIVSRSAWLEARKALLTKEKALKRQLDALAAERQSLPLVLVGDDYLFQAETGKVALSDLFGDSGQLIIYHFMFAEDAREGCKSCSFWADNFSATLPHLKARNTAFACVSIAPVEKLMAYRKRMNWTFPWVSSHGTSFGEDFGVSFPANGNHPEGYNYSGKPAQGELPGLSIFLRRQDGTIAHSYSTFARGLEPLNVTYALLDMTPQGRNEEGLSPTMAWVRRYDQY